MSVTPNYWDMPDGELAAAYTAIANPFVQDANGANAETLAFIEDAIMQRIGAPEDADPSVSEEWQKVLVRFVEAASA